MSSVSPGHFVFVHGAWHHSSQWDAVRRELTDSPTSTVDLRSTGQDPARLGDLYADADAVRIHVTRVREADPAAQITVVAHSYAGIPVAQGLCPDGSQVLADRLVFLGAFLLDVGESLWSAVGAVAPDWWAYPTPNVTSSIPLTPSGTSTVTYPPSGPCRQARDCVISGCLPSPKS